MCELSVLVLVLHNQLIAGQVGRQVEWNSSGGGGRGSNPLRGRTPFCTPPLWLCACFAKCWLIFAQFFRREILLATTRNRLATKIPSTSIWRRHGDGREIGATFFASRCSSGM